MDIGLFFTAFLVTAGLVVIQRRVSGPEGREAKTRELLAEVALDSFFFVGLEYYRGVINRTYVVFVMHEMLCGAKVRGVLPSPLRSDVRWDDPYFYIRSKHLQKVQGVGLESPEFLSRNRDNFQIPRNSFQGAKFSNKEKWGMGRVPSSGIIVISTNSDKREFILLGQQDGIEIEKLLSDWASERS